MKVKELIAKLPKIDYFITGQEFKEGIFFLGLYYLVFNLGLFMAGILTNMYVSAMTANLSGLCSLARQDIDTFYGYCFFGYKLSARFVCWLFFSGNCV